MNEVEWVDTPLLSHTAFLSCYQSSMNWLLSFTKADLKKNEAAPSVHPQKKVIHLFIIMKSDLQTDGQTD